MKSNQKIGFGTIRNSTALKQSALGSRCRSSFGTIRNSTALKHTLHIHFNVGSFGTIRNSTALKPRGPIFVSKFRNRAIRPS